MNTRSVLTKLCLLVLIGAGIGLANPTPMVYAQATCNSTQGLSLDSEVQRSTSGSTQCYRINVADEQKRLTVALRSRSGEYDVYLASGATSSFVADEHQINLTSIRPADAPTTFVVHEPVPGTYTLAVAPRGQQNASYTLEVASGHTETETRETECSGDICRSYSPLTATVDARIGSERGAQAVFPFRVMQPGNIKVSADWTGTARNLALILNGPGQVGYYRRVDGSAPLNLSYNVTAADVQKGSRWWVSLVNFSGGEALANLVIDYPDALPAVASNARIDDFVGMWHNVDAKTGGITRIEIGRSGSNLLMHSWGACVPQDCDHGTTSVRFQGSPVTLVRTSSFKRETLTLQQQADGRLNVRSANIFTDGTNRDYIADYQFRRLTMEQAVDRPGQDLRSFDLPRADPELCRAACAQESRCQAYTYVKPGVQGAKARCWLKHSVPAAVTNNCCTSGKAATAASVQSLAAPRQLVPADGAVFSHFPRTTLLRWESAPGAATYAVEIDCYHCCQSGKWCTDVGRTWKIVTDLRATSYSFDFVGAQPGRWRVWAVDASGRAGPKSGWWEFRYTR